jgi:hypothetical protein
MPVVINDFEIVPEPAPTQAASGADHADGKSTKGDEQPDLQDLLRQAHQRHERVRAH